MIKNIILDFRGSVERVKIDDLSSYEGDQDLSQLLGLEAIADTRDLSLSFLGETFPTLEKLRLNNSIIPSIRDIGCSLVNLRFLSLARCEISCLDGISTISQQLEELYLAFNQINDVCDLLGMDNLTILDLEDNLIPTIDSVAILSTSPKLKALTMAGNPAADIPDYREQVAKILPNLVYLDEKRLKPKKTKTPRPPSIPKSPSPSTVVSFDEKAIEQSSKPSTPNEMEMVHVVPLNLSTLNDDEELIMTEQILDQINERPPSSYGSFESNVLPGFKKAPVRTSSKNNIMAASKPKIYRPMSAKGRQIQ